MLEITWHESLVSRPERTRALRQKGATIWLTGLPAAGKSTIARRLEQKLVVEARRWAYRLDGDNIRHGLNCDLGFSPANRRENVRRTAEVPFLLSSDGQAMVDDVQVAKLMADAGAIVVASFISPYEEDRAMARAIHAKDEIPFYEVSIHVPIEVAEARDPKGLYAKAKIGLIPNFTGVNAPYEKPTNPDLVIDTTKLSANEAADRLYQLIVDEGLLHKQKKSRGSVAPSSGVAMEQEEEEAAPPLLQAAAPVPEAVALAPEAPAPEATKKAAPKKRGPKKAKVAEEVRQKTPEPKEKPAPPLPLTPTQRPAETEEAGEENASGEAPAKKPRAPRHCKMCKALGKPFEESIACKGRGGKHHCPYYQENQENQEKE